MNCIGLLQPGARSADGGQGIHRIGDMDEIRFVRPILPDKCQFTFPFTQHPFQGGGFFLQNPYLEGRIAASALAEIGAAPAGDDIFAASCYCPITNLDHADMAYEWEFGGLDEYHRMNFERDEATGEVKMTPDTGLMTPEQIALSRELKEMFPAYLNSLQLKEEDGCPLMLNKDGEGTFQEYIKRQVIASIEKALESGADLSEYGWINSREGKVRDIDFQEYIAYRTRMKTTPAFDDITLKTPENELFGDAHTASRHFTQFSLSHSSAAGKMAEEDQIKRMNPMNYIGDEKCSTAPYFRIRHGASDRDTSLAVSAMLTAALRAHGAEVDYHLPWGLAHAGDYDLPELFHWIDDICKPIHRLSQKGLSEGGDRR